MQRWIVVGVLVLMLAVGGGGFAYWNHKQNLPDPRWVPVAVRADFPKEAQEQTVRDLREKLADPELLTKVVREMGLKEKWGLSSEREAEQQLAGRIFVRMGEMDTQIGQVPALHVGVSGKRKERQLSGEIAVRLMKDVWAILGIKPPPTR